jgi:hypothetical protein
MNKGNFLVNLLNKLILITPIHFRKKRVQMFGFVRSEREIRPLGGEVIRLKKRRVKILLGFVLLTGFLILNLVLYYLTNI